MLQLQSASKIKKIRSLRGKDVFHGRMNPPSMLQICTSLCFISSSQSCAGQAHFKPTCYHIKPSMTDKEFPAPLFYGTLNECLKIHLYFQMCFQLQFMYISVAVTIPSCIIYLILDPRSS